LSIAWRSARDFSGSGCPAVTYGMNARRPCSRSALNRRAMASDEIVADTDSVAFWVLGLDDRAVERAFRITIGEVHERPRMLHCPHRVAHDANHGTRQHFGKRIDGVHDAELEGIENHEGAHRI